LLLLLLLLLLLKNMIEAVYFSQNTSLKLSTWAAGACTFVAKTNVDNTYAEVLERDWDGLS